MSKQPEGTWLLDVDLVPSAANCLFLTTNPVENFVKELRAAPDDVTAQCMLIKWLQDGLRAAGRGNGP